MQVNVSWSKALQFVGSSSKGNEILMDGNGGENGPSPMECVLMALGGCSSVDIVSDLQQANQDVVNCEVKIDAQRAEKAPRVFTQINLLYQVSGNQVDPQLVEKAVKASMQQFCSVAKMLEPQTVINADFEVIEQA
ncbi:OsmC family protein [Motilimonas pumila]|uniref:OsmC family protein n=1 Tax=Motilimonas pumila TaxID=2303987 RepID=A0A418YFA3_9GAMM|nr:OsmC family protein [Motilimonas pumila]RJG47945.1 OsmC family protein [Motilimonas pumila]